MDDDWFQYVKNVEPASALGIRPLPFRPIQAGKFLRNGTSRSKILKYEVIMCFLYYPKFQTGIIVIMELSPSTDSVSAVESPISVIRRQWVWSRERSSSKIMCIWTEMSESWIYKRRYIAMSRLTWMLTWRQGAVWPIYYHLSFLNRTSYLVLIFLFLSCSLNFLLDSLTHHGFRHRYVAKQAKPKDLFVCLFFFGIAAYQAFSTVFLGVAERAQCLCWTHAVYYFD